MAERNAIAVLIKLLGAAEMTAELKKLGGEGEKALASIQEAAEKVQFAGLGNNIANVIAQAETVAKRSVIALGILKGAADAVGATLFFLAKSGAEAADAAGKSAQAAGLSAKSYQEWAFAADSVGVSQQQMNTALNTFSKQVNKTASEAAAGGKKIGGAFGQAGQDIVKGIGYTVQTFKDLDVTVTRFGDNAKGAGDKAKAGAARMKTGFDDLGISVRNADGTLKTNEQLLVAVANAFQKMPDGAVKSAIALKLFGESGAKLIPLLDQGAAGIEEFKQKAAELGIVFTDEQISAAAKFNDSLNELKKAAGGLFRQLGLIFVPSFTTGLNAFRDLILRNKQAVLDFANNALAKAKVLVSDFFAALSGRDADVNNKWIIAWRDAIVGFGDDAKRVITGVVIPAIEKVKAGADIAAKGLNALSGAGLSGGELLITFAILRATGALRGIIEVGIIAVKTLASFSAFLVANPWALALTAVAGGIAIWATRTDEATAALRVHEDLVGKVRDAYDEAGRKVANMTQEMKDQAVIASGIAADAAQKALPDAIDQAITAIGQFEGQLPHAADGLFKLFDQFKNNKDVEAFRKSVADIGANNPGLKNLAQQFLDATEPAHKLTTDLQEANNWIALYTNKISDSDFAARQAQLGIAGWGNVAKQAGSDAAASLDKTSAAADQTDAKVKNLGQTITVFRGGANGISKEVFDVVDGVAHRADQSKQALDGVASSAAKAQDDVKNVSNEITNSISDAVKPDATKAGVDGIVGDIGTIAPAAQTAASEVSAAFGNLDAGGAAAAATAILAPFQGLPGQISAIFAGIQNLVGTGFGNLAATVSSLAAQIRSEISSIISALQQAVSQAQSLRSQASSLAATSGGSHGGFAEGGHVVGPGGPKSDSILAWLSNGEFVLQAAAVRRLGVGFLNALNNGFIPSLKGLRGFNMGGVVERFNQSLAIPAFAGGGFAAAAIAPTSNAEPGRTLRLKLDFGLGAQDVIDLVTDDFVGVQFERTALKLAQARAGRRPSRGK